jgi:hypothetical protein
MISISEINRSVIEFTRSTPQYFYKIAISKKNNKNKEKLINNLLCLSSNTNTYNNNFLIFRYFIEYMVYTDPQKQNNNSLYEYINKRVK